MTKLNMHHEAIFYQQLGYFVLPIPAGQKFPPPPGFTRLMTQPDIPEQCNIAICPRNDIWVLDIDVGGKNEIDQVHSWAMNSLAHPTTPVVRTPSGGLHLYFRSPFAPAQSQGRCKLYLKPNGSLEVSDGPLNALLVATLDVRTSNGYVLAPPSTVNGRSYQFVEPLARASDLQAPRDLKVIAPLWNRQERTIVQIPQSSQAITTVQLSFGKSQQLDYYLEEAVRVFKQAGDGRRKIFYNFLWKLARQEFSASELQIAMRKFHSVLSLHNSYHRLHKPMSFHALQSSLTSFLRDNNYEQ